MTIAMVAIALAFLSPLLQSALTSLKTPEQITQPNSPLLPSDPATFEFEGETYDVYYVPIDGATRELALVKKGRQQSEFIDPANPAAGPDRLGWVLADARPAVAARARMGELRRGLGR